ncbi:MAG: tRNA 2-thiouridine(34) synthase MnmA [Victivallales bacterium]|nr:tRNA 2-thiouridine(34) synthase MnmA [Victivallales bacterium]MCF7889088.1 tRNA 2-thiouridine(34) synthase MnmA [Victivallales bacterium]
MGFKNVISALSGGVDSSVATALYKKKNYNIIAVTLLNSSNKDLSVEEINAAKICSFLNIKHVYLECSEKFKKIVLKYSFDKYKSGSTPNPCAYCNRNFKFAELLKLADKYNASTVITGHYTKKIMDKNGVCFIKRGKDYRKDQSYFLSRLTKNQLKRIEFPLGDLSKKEVREQAKQLKLKTAESAESQDVCYIQKNQNFQDVLAEIFNYSPPPGNIVDKEGNILGRHKGIYKYTVGQRKGLNIAMGKPAFISHINSNKNEIFLSTDEDDLMSNFLTAVDFNWFCSKEDIDLNKKYFVQIRYRHKPAEARIVLLENNEVLINFREPQRAVTRGQVAAVYDDDILLGGGWIKSYGKYEQYI